jgi:peptide/nickel transport system substrate-binding protein
MSGDLRPGRIGGLIALLTVAGMLITGCTGSGDRPEPSPSGSPTPQRPFTIMTTDTVKTADPAAVADTGSTMLTQNVFQRLMTAEPTGRFPQPDAARDCKFESRTSYECTLPSNLKFSNGDPLTSRDVKFSIQRAARLDVAGSSASALSSLRRIETPDKVTVRFVLSREDTQFPWALAAPAASIVDAKVYNSDKVQPNDQPIVGSGPFTVDALTKNTLALEGNPDYRGHAPAKINKLVIKSMPDSASIEEAMTKGQVDVVWRGLSNAAQQRLQAQISSSKEQVSKAGFSRVILPGARVEQLIWNPASKHRNSAALRNAITAALQEDRTLDSVVPDRVPGHHSSFPLGGKAKIKIPWDNRIQLTLGYDSTAPNSQDLANQIRTRLEDTGGMSVLLKADDPDADLQLVDRKAWTQTGAAWLQPVIDHPTSSSAAKKIDQAESKVRKSGVGTASLSSALSTLQTLAAKERTVLPISQTNEVVYVSRKATVNGSSFGPGWQLGLSGIKIKK